MSMGGSDPPLTPAAEGQAGHQQPMSPHSTSLSFATDQPQEVPPCCPATAFKPTSDFCPPLSPLPGTGPGPAGAQPGCVISG